MKYALWDITRDGYLDGGDFRTVLWGNASVAVEQAKLYDTEKAAISIAKRLMNEYAKYQSDPHYQKPKHGEPQLVLVELHFEVRHSYKID